MLVQGMNRLVTLLLLYFVTTEAKNAIWKAVCGRWTPAQQREGCVLYW